MEGNYYANYFKDLSGLVGVGYGDFGASRDLTRKQGSGIREQGSVRAKANARG
jgi:hypothetical protein